jgi:undecaprenyl diphosphate synthase
MGTEMDWIRDLDKDRLPEHVAIIMDGNGRWAKSRGKPRVFGHKQGVHAVREVTEGSAELGIPYLTLYAFSTENWNRPKMEVNALMSLLVSTMDREIETLQKNNIRLQTIGDITMLPRRNYESLRNGIEQTRQNTGMTLILALNYSGRWDLVRAMQKLAGKIKSGQMTEAEINHDTFAALLSTADLPDPSLLIRTSGELRLSNFLLWEMAYTELYFTDVMWPDFTKNNLYLALKDYQQRERRFGKISEQI